MQCFQVNPSGYGLPARLTFSGDFNFWLFESKFLLFVKRFPNWPLNLYYSFAMPEISLNQHD